jgi:hypothetical protein
MPCDISPQYCHPQHLFLSEWNDSRPASSRAVGHGRAASSQTSVRCFQVSRPDLLAALGESWAGTSCTSSAGPPRPRARPRGIGRHPGRRGPVRGARSPPCRAAARRRRPMRARQSPDYSPFWSGAGMSILRLPDNDLAPPPPTLGKTVIGPVPGLPKQLVVDWRSAETVALDHKKSVLGYLGARHWWGLR